MVFKGRFFSKKSDTSSPEGSNSPRSLGSNSPIRSDKKKVKPTKDDPQIGDSVSGFTSSCRQTQVKDGLKQQQQSVKKKDVNGKEAQTPAKASLAAAASNSGSGNSNLGSKPAKEVPAAVSPILASSLGLNRIKTRSGPLPQESFFGFRGEKGSSAVGASKLSKPVGDGFSSSSGSGFGSRGVGKEEEANQTRKVSEENVSFGGWVDTGSNSDSMSTESGPSRDLSPHIRAGSRLRNGESSLESGRLPLTVFFGVSV
ncbi:non-specific serine,threonine protein kinase [Sarracenia purpurea var. burkii]